MERLNPNKHDDIDLSISQVEDQEGEEGFDDFKGDFDGEMDQ